MNIIFQKVGFQFLLDNNIQELLTLHHEEVNNPQDTLDIDFEKYLFLDSIGNLVNIAAISDNKIVGYVCFFVSQHLHHRSLKYALDDFYYIHPDYRKGRNGINLFKFSENILKELGVNRIILSTKVKQNHSKILKYLGYENTDLLFTKQI